MITKVKKYMEKYHMVNSGDQVVVGLSGGADSVCLLFLLKELSDQMGFLLQAVHINHGLREEADEEERFVKTLCQKWQVPCKTYSVDVKTYAKEQHFCIEEAARKLRYRIFEQVCAEAGNVEKTKIALAHHQNDQAETVLFHLFRGSGIRGMAGIRPVRECYIRPLLCVERKEIEQFIEENKLEYVTDMSNFDTVYARNKIRHDLLPMAEEEICHGSTVHIAQSAELITDAADFLEEITGQAYRQFVKESEKGCHIDKEKLKEMHPYLKSAVIYEMLSRTSKRKRDISKVHVDSVLRLLEGQSGRQVTLIYGLSAFLQQQDLMIMMEQDEKGTETFSEKSLDLSGTINVKGDKGIGGMKICCRVFSYDKTQTIPHMAYTKWFDYDKINNHPVLRNRRTGDYLYCSDTARKKLKDYFINEKIPLSERNGLFLIADGDHIMWIPGYRISSFYKVTDKTLNILEITISGGMENESQDQRTPFGREG